MGKYRVSARADVTLEVEAASPEEVTARAETAAARLAGGLVVFADGGEVTLRVRTDGTWGPAGPPAPPPGPFRRYACKVTRVERSVARLFVRARNAEEAEAVALEEAGDDDFVRVDDEWDVRVEEEGESGDDSA